MADRIRVCPVCGNELFDLFLEGKDYFLSGEEFRIIRCRGCGFRITDPIPDQGEIGRYYESREYISHDSGERKLINLVYKGARFFTVRSKFSLVKKYSRGRKLMDIGCGTGEFLAHCKKNGYDCSGIEPNEKARTFASVQNGLEVRASVTFRQDEAGSFDCITMWHVLEHIHDLSGTLRLLKSALKENGTLVLALPNPESWDAKFYGAHWAAYDLPRHLYHFSADNVSTLAEGHGFKLKKILPQYLDAFYISMLSENYRRGKKDPFRGFINGLRSNLRAPGKGFGYSSHIYILSANFS